MVGYFETNTGQSAVMLCDREVKADRPMAYSNCVVNVWSALKYPALHSYTALLLLCPEDGKVELACITDVNQA